MLYIAVVPGSTETATNPPSDGAKASTVRRYFDAIQAGDATTLVDVLVPDAVTRWPQSGEQITGAMTCVRVYERYPGGPPQLRVERVLGSGDVWVAELVADYGTERWYVTSIVEFDGDRIARLTDWFAPQLPAPEWRRELVDGPAGTPPPVRA